MGDSVTGVEVRVDDLYEAEAVGRRIGAELGFPLSRARLDGGEYNLFAALALRRPCTSSCCC